MPEALSFLKHHLNCRFEIFSLAGDASTRKYYRVICDQSTWVLMSWEPFENEANYPFLNILKHLNQSGVLVPKVSAVSPSLGLVLLEDLGDLTLERKFWENQDQSLAQPFYEKALDQIIRFHVDATKPTQPKPLCQVVQFDVPKFMWELNYAKTHLLEGMCKLQLSPNVVTQLEAVFLKICQRLDQQTKVVCHRDYHSRNIMLKLGKTYIIDFQDARLGPCHYDMVSLLHDSYVDMEDWLRNSLLDSYLSELGAKGGPKYSKSEFMDVFQIQIIQRCFKACGSFASFYVTRGDTRYLKYIAPTVRKVLHALDTQKGMDDFTNILRGEGLAEQFFEELCEP